MAKEAFNKALIYDDNCPLCQAYSAAFVSTGFLKKENRISFSQINSCTLTTGTEFNRIDWQKARHEIPLVDLTNGEVKYGVDALVDVLSQKLPCVRTAIRQRLLRTFFTILYKFISYNRKVIAANCNPVKSGFDCSPEYRFFWRYMLIVVTWSLSFFFTTLASAQVNGSGESFDARIAFFVLLLMPWPLGFCKNKKLTADLYAHAGIVCVITSLLLLLLFFLKNIFHLPDLLFYTLYGGVEYIFIRQFVQRIRFIKLMQ